MYRYGRLRPREVLVGVIVYFVIGIAIVTLMHLGQNCHSELLSHGPGLFDCPTPEEIGFWVIIWPIVAGFYLVYYTGWTIAHILAVIGHLVILLTGGTTR